MNDTVEHIEVALKLVLSMYNYVTFNIYLKYYSDKFFLYKHDNPINYILIQSYACTVTRAHFKTE